MCFKITIDSSVQVWTSQYLLITSGACFKWPTSHTPCREKETPAMRTFRRIQLQSSALQRKFLQLQWKRQQLPRLNLHNGYLSLLNHRVFILFFFFLYAFLFPLSNLGFLTYLDQKSCRLFFFFSPPSDNLVICLQINCKRFTVHLKAKRIHISQLPPPFQTHDHPSIYTVTVQSLCTMQETSYVYKAMHQLVPHKVITAQRSL